MCFKLNRVCLTVFVALAVVNQSVVERFVFNKIEACVDAQAYWREILALPFCFQWSVRERRKIQSFANISDTPKSHWLMVEYG